MLLFTEIVTKIMQTRGKKACFLFPECSFSFAKVMQTSAMRVYSQIAECSLSSAKIMQGECNSKAEKRSFFRLDIAEPKLIFCKDDANERNESLLSNCRVQLIFCKGKIFFRYLHHKNGKTVTARPAADTVGKPCRHTRAASPHSHLQRCRQGFMTANICLSMQ